MTASDSDFELASAYLDGELSDDDRARAEADPSVRALVADLQGLRDRLTSWSSSDGDEAVSGDVREGAIAAALAEFDASMAAGPAASLPSSDDQLVITAAGHVIVPPPASRAAQRWHWTRPLTAAAAAVVVVAAGFAVWGNRDGGDSTAGEVARDALVVTTSPVVDRLDAELAEVAPAQAAESADDADPAAADQASGAAPDPAAAAPVPTLLSAAPAAPGAGLVEPVELDGTHEFADYVAELSSTVSLPDEATARIACEAGDLEPTLDFRDDEGDDHDAVLVAIGTEIIGAFDIDTCRVVVSISRP